MKKAEFMRRTIESHALPMLTLYDASNLLREPNYFEAKRIAARGSYFESMDILVSDNNFVRPPQSAFVKSFDKWLAIQKHDVNAVNSLYEWRKAVRIAEIQTEEDIYDMEQLALSPALQIHVEKMLARKRDEAAKLTTLRHELEDAIERVKATKYTARASA